MRFLADYLREPRITAIRPNRPTPNRLRLVGSGVSMDACAALVAVTKAMPLKSKHTILFMIIPPITSDDLPSRKSYAKSNFTCFSAP
jgi:hypothetical protein